jgi:hypothetical protein
MDCRVKPGNDDRVEMLFVKRARCLLTHPQNARHPNHILGRKHAILVLGIERATLDRAPSFCAHPVGWVAQAR